MLLACAARGVGTKGVYFSDAGGMPSDGARLSILRHPQPHGACWKGPEMPFPFLCPGKRGSGTPLGWVPHLRLVEGGWEGLESAKPSLTAVPRKRLQTGRWEAKWIYSLERSGGRWMGQEVHKTVFSSSLSLSSHGTPRALINKGEMCFLPGAGDGGADQHRGADRSRLKTDGTAGHCIQGRWKK